MKTRTPRIVLLAAVASTVAQAQYDTLFFSTNETDYECPGLPYRCQYPYACALDEIVNKYYCCIPGSSYDVCWTGSTSCSGDNNTAGSNQLACGGYCCLETREICTQREGQINICWATADNPLGDVSDEQMNDTYSSLASISPSATELSFQLAQVTTFPAGTTFATNPTTTASSSTASPTYYTPSNNAVGEGSPNLPRGAMVGIVLGALCGLVLLFIAISCFYKRHHRKSHPPGTSHDPSQRPSMKQLSGEKDVNREFSGYYAPALAGKGPPPPQQQQQQQQQQQEQQASTMQPDRQPEPVPQELESDTHGRSEIDTPTTREI